MVGSSDEFLLVDPLMDVERFLELMNDSRGKVVGVVDTHIHADHLSGSREIQRIFGCPLLMHEGTAVNFQFDKLSEGEHELAGLKVRVIHTPGHAPEHICLLVEDAVLLSGDCLLIGDVGRIDLGRGNVEQSYDSLYTKLLNLDDRVEVLPAHVGEKHFVSGGTSSTIGIERRSNPALQLKSRSEFLHYMTKGWPLKPAHYELFVEVNRGMINLSEAQELAKAKQGELYSD